MINVTTSAKDVLQDVLEDATQRADVHSEQVGLRLAPTSDGGQPQLGLILDEPKEGDQVIEYNGKNLLMVSQPISSQLDGATLDTVETSEGQRLTLTRDFYVNCSGTTPHLRRGPFFVLALDTGAVPDCSKSPI